MQTKRTQAIKFEVQFTSLRAPERAALFKRLWGVSDDLTRAATKILGALFLVKQGMLTLPMDQEPRRAPKPGADGKVAEWIPKPWPLKSAAYRGFSGEWQPYSEGPMYVPYKDNPRACGNVLSTVAGHLHTRLETDYLDTIRGKKQLATFKRMPIMVSNQGAELRPDGAIAMHVFGGKDGGWVVMRPRKLDGSRNAIMHRLREGTLKLGSCALSWHERKKKWMLSISYTNEAHEIVDVPVSTAVAAEGSAPMLVAGVDVGIQHAAWVAFLDLDGKPTRDRPMVIPFPRRTLRATAQIAVERRERHAFNREDLGVRAGRGKRRKLRALDAIGDRVQRLNDTMIEQIAASVVLGAKRRGVGLLAIEEHGDFAEQVHVRASFAKTLSEAAKIRKSFFRLHAGAMREALLKAGAREGLNVVQVDAAWTSQTCHRCGITWKMHGLSARAHGDGTESEAVLQSGRFEHRRFRCSADLQGSVLNADGSAAETKQGCGYEGQADHNAAINIARLGLRVHRGEADAKIAVVRKPKKKVAVKVAATAGT